ncbi:MAG: hypothetical protein ACR2KZ_05415 [Segetibacter sp.]
MQLNFTLNKKNNYTVTEGDYNYTMPFILKHLLDKNLVYIQENPNNSPIKKWYLSLSKDRQLLIEVTLNKKIIPAPVDLTSTLLNSPFDH